MTPMGCPSPNFEKFFKKSRKNQKITLRNLLLVTRGNAVKCEM